jgi:hypothetical protein
MEPTGNQQSNEKEDVVGSILRPLRTFKDDVAAALGRKGAGIVSIASSEEKRRGKRRVLSEREQVLQEEIEREGAKIRMLSAEIENVTDQSGVPTREFPQEPEKPKETYVPPPGIPLQMVRVPSTPEASAEQFEARKHSKQVAELHAAEKRLAEAEAKLLATRQSQLMSSPTLLKPEPREKSVLPRTLIMLSISAVLLISASGIGWYVYKNFSILGTVEPDGGVPTVVPVNVKIEVIDTPVSPLVETLDDAARAVSTPRGNLVQLYVTKWADDSRILLSTQEFIERLAPRAPGRFVRALETTYTFGVHTRERPSPFLVAKVTFFENAFAGMLEWEATMRNDLAPLFNPEETGPSLSRVAPVTTTEVIRRGVFHDQVIQNKDARVFLDQNDNIVLLYSFIDRETLILTTNIETFIEVHGRLTSGRVVR